MLFKNMHVKQFISIVNLNFDLHDVCHVNFTRSQPRLTLRNLLLFINTDQCKTLFNFSK